MGIFVCCKYIIQPMFFLLFPVANKQTVFVTERQHIVDFDCFPYKMDFHRDLKIFPALFVNASKQMHNIALNICRINCEYTE